MEKTTITKEQAEFLNREKQEGKLKHETIKRFVQIYGEHGCDFHLDELIRALYIGYEVEETFEVGDWIYSKQVEKIIQINDEGSLAGYNTFPTYYRHATPEEIEEEKQRRWWAEHGRDVWELRENDILYYDDEFKEVEDVSEIGAIMLSSERVYTPIETIKNKYSVACFAEDRKDVEYD